MAKYAQKYAQQICLLNVFLAITGIEFHDSGMRRSCANSWGISLLTLEKWRALLWVPSLVGALGVPLVLCQVDMLLEKKFVPNVNGNDAALQNAVFFHFCTPTCQAH